MVTRNKQFFFSLFWITAILYVTIAVPVIQFAISQSRAIPHFKHYCDCGCGGDPTKCTCDQHAGTVGFTHCSTRLNTLVPMVIILTADILQLLNIIPSSRKLTFPKPQNEDAEQQLFAAEIFHPPNL